MLVVMLSEVFDDLDWFTEKKIEDGGKPFHDMILAKYLD
jgi:hypothetical protein